MRNAVLTAALVLAAGAALADAARPAVAVVALRSEAAPFEDRVTLRGRTEADRRVEVRAEIAGVVSDSPVRKGATVAAGAPLCRLDPGERPAALAEARAALDKAEADFIAAERLSERGFTAEIETRTRAAALEAARAQVMRAEIDIARLTLSAPFDGVLEDDTAERGALLQPGSLCATVLALDPVILVGYAPERDVDRLAVGAPAEGRLVTGRPVEGVIRFVARAADSDTRTYRVEVEAPNADLSIRDGMSAEIAIGVRAADAHFVPQSALTLDDGGALGVRLNENGVARFAPVTVLRDAPGGVWLAGLPPVAEIIVVGQEFVSDGSALAVTYAEAAR